MTEAERDLLLLVADIVAGELIPATRADASKAFDLIQRIRQAASTRGPAGVGVPEDSGAGVSMQGGLEPTPKNFGKYPA